MLSILNEKMRVGDVVTKYPNTRPVLEKLGIDYCCGGDRDLKSAATDKGVEINRLLESLSQTLEAGVSGEGEKNWSAAPLTELVDYIERRHHLFMKEQLLRLQALFETVLKAHSERHGNMLSALRETFGSLRGEIEEHLMKEEQILFPSIRQIDAYVHGAGDKPVIHCGSVQNPIRQMEHEHDNAGAALKRMRALTSGYSLPDDACNTFGSLYDGLQAVENDLHTHIHLENNILFPRAIAQEKACGIADAEAATAVDRDQPSHL